MTPNITEDKRHAAFKDGMKIKIPFKILPLLLKTALQFTIGTVVFCYQNCSDLLREKIVLAIEKNF